MHLRKLILVIVIVSIIHTNAIRVDSKVETTTKTSESANDPKAEALTLVIHNFPPSKLRHPLKLSARNDDVVVIHSNRQKRKPSTRKRRPSNQFRSKIKFSSPGSSSNFGGFKDFSTSDSRFPPFPSKNFGEPPKASNKYKHASSRPYENYKYSAQASKKSRRPTTVYGPPPTFNQFENTYVEDSSPFDGKPLQTLQQQQNNFPSYSIDTVEPSSSNNFGTSYNKFAQPINNFPLETGPSYNSQKTSYGNPIRQSSSNSNNYQFNPNTLSTSLITNSNSDTISNGNSNSNFNPNLNSNHNFNPNQNFNSNANPKPSSNFHANLDAILNSNANSNTNSNSNFNSNSNSNSNFNSNSNSNSNYLANLNSNPNTNFKANSNFNANSNSNFPKLPSRYEPKDFTTPTRTNPINNQFLNDYSQYNDVSESQNIPTTNKNRFKNFNKFNNFDYDFKGQKNSAPEDDDDDDDDVNIEYLFSTRRPQVTTTTTTTTPQPPPSSTKRPRKNGFGKRKRPGKISQSHVLDTDDLRDAYTESSDFHEVALSSDDFVNFDSQRHSKRNQRPKQLHEIHSTLKTARDQNSALRAALGEDYQILSVQKSLEKNPSEVDFGFQRKSDHSDHNDHYVVGSDIRFGSANAASVVWNGDFKNFPRNHRFS